MRSKFVTMGNTSETTDEYKKDWQKKKQKIVKICLKCIIFCISTKDDSVLSFQNCIFFRTLFQDKNA